jgi:hypothetical protein
MKTLVIHPKDITTDFLSVIYADKKDWTIVNDFNVSKKELKELIKSHDRIVMLGHGTEDGLIAMTNSYDYKSIINSTWVYLLREKQCVCIWCNADVFVKKYDIKGFYTGMIISESDEANLYCIKCKYEDIEQSNVLFADSVKKSIDNTNMLNEMVESYKGENPVIDFNKKNLYFN